MDNLTEYDFVNEDGTITCDNCANDTHRFMINRDLNDENICDNCRYVLGEGEWEDEEEDEELVS